MVQLDRLLDSAWTQLESTTERAIRTVQLVLCKYSRNVGIQTVLSEAVQRHVIETRYQLFTKINYTSIICWKYSYELRYVVGLPYIHT